MVGAIGVEGGLGIGVVGMTGVTTGVLVRHTDGCPEQVYPDCI